MKYKKLINIVFLLTFIFSFGCSNNSSSNHYAKLDTLPNDIFGKWGGLGEDSPVWEIRKDSIYYFQEQKAYPYKMNGNDLIVELPPNERGSLKNITVDTDTMTFYDEQGIKVKAFRFR